jgi:hypothetical protein
MLNQQIQNPTNYGEFGIRSGVFKIEGFRRDEKSGLFSIPDFVQEFKNAYVNTGGALVGDLIIGAGGTAFNNANAYLGVGDSSTAVAASQTDLVAATNKLRKAMDATFPSRASQVVTFKSTFATGDANWTWNEVAIFNAAAAGVMLCRALVASPFTKTSALAVTLTYTLTIP